MTPAVTKHTAGQAHDSGVSLMDFRLLYDGPLASEGDRFQKHEIRRALHPQLSALWQHHPVLDRIKQTRVGDVDPSTGGFQTRFTELVNKFRKEPFRFVPLVTESLNLVCTLDILFLRREAPGSLVNNKGDTDNRIKTLFDALRYPGEPNELDGIVPQGVDETNLFFCLLEDALSAIDRLTLHKITAVCGDPKRDVTMPDPILTRRHLNWGGDAGLTFVEFSSLSDEKDHWRLWFMTDDNAMTGQVINETSLNAQRGPGSGETVEILRELNLRFPCLEKAERR